MTRLYNGYKYFNCEFCGDRGSSSGLAQLAHYKKHARVAGIRVLPGQTAGEIKAALERKRGKVLEPQKPEEAAAKGA